MGYLNQIIALAASLPADAVNHIMVIHEDHCELLKTGGACTCSPTVALMQRDGGENEG